MYKYISRYDGERKLYDINGSRNWHLAYMETMLASIIVCCWWSSHLAVKIRVWYAILRCDRHDGCGLHECSVL